MTDTQLLLAQYAKDGSEPAFRELVARYIDLVYSTAYRLAGGDGHLAQDVAQTVFVDLARKARTLPSDVMLGGWLHQHTRFVAGKTLRGERRRQNRERQAAEMNALEDHSEANLAQVTPILDEAIGQLDAADRTAILLRYFEQKDLRSVGEALGSSEDAARKRVSRALDQLQSLLKRRGVALSAAVLGSILAAQAVTAAPAGLAASVAGTALAGAGGAASFLTALAMTKTKLAFAAAIVIATVTATVLLQRKSETKMRGANQSPQPIGQEAIQPIRSLATEDGNSVTNYVVKDLGTLPGFNSVHVMALNNHGQMVGSVDSTNNETHAFFWDDGVMTDLGTFGGSKSLASDINDTGDIVGIILTNGERHAFLRHDGKISDLGMIDQYAKLGEEGDKYRGGPGTIYYAPRVTINGLSQVAGHVSGGQDNPRSFLLDRGRTSYFGLTGDGNIFYAESINNRGQILGRATQRGGPMRSMLWQNGGLVDLGSLGLTPAAINDHGTMVGWMVPTNGTTKEGQAFIMEHGTVRRLNTGSRKGCPSAINNSGRVVGYAQKSGNRNYACIWNGDEILDLNDLVPMKSGWRLVSARAINDRGQILAREVKGGQQRDCLLSPLKLPPLLEDEAATAPAPREQPAAAIVPFNLTSFERLPGGAFRLAFAGKPEGKYVIMASTNLAAWTVLGPAANNGGKVEFTDGEAAKYTMRFYRAVLAP